MRIWVTVTCGESAGKSRVFARTCDPALVRQVLKGLVKNRHMEDDGRDEISDPAFLASAQSYIAALTAEIRQTACHLWLGEAAEDDEYPPSEPDRDAEDESL